MGQIRLLIIERAKKKVQNGVLHHHPPIDFVLLNHVRIVHGSVVPRGCRLFCQVNHLKNFRYFRSIFSKISGFFSFFRFFRFFQIFQIFQVFSVFSVFFSFFAFFSSYCFFLSNKGKRLEESYFLFILSWTKLEIYDLLFHQNTIFFSKSGFGRWRESARVQTYYLCLEGWSQSMALFKNIFLIQRLSIKLITAPMSS